MEKVVDLIPQKSIEDSFTDWEAHVFGFGYGTGEEHTISALMNFFLAFRDEDQETNSYDYKKLEAAVTPAVAWLLINILCHADIIEYGVSPRYGWLTPKGGRLRKFMLSKSIEQLVDLTCKTEDYDSCSPNSCNHGPEGYVAGRKCVNPFW